MLDLRGEVERAQDGLHERDRRLVLQEIQRHVDHSACTESGLERSPNEQLEVGRLPNLPRSPEEVNRGPVEPDLVDLGGR
jgi:hypothetical protein